MSGDDLRQSSTRFAAYVASEACGRPLLCSHDLRLSCRAVMSGSKGKRPNYGAVEVRKVAQGQKLAPS
eukprot:scaffold109_cov252-Pinguiococcus_pyrenoidosus.AAC.40